MKFALHCIDDGSRIEFPTEQEVWQHVRANDLCSEEISDEELPPRRVLNPSYRILTIATDGELIAMSRLRWTHASLEEWDAAWPDT